MAQTHSRADFIRELLKIFKILNKPFSRSQFDMMSDIPSRTVERHFGSWAKAIKESGLEPKFQALKDVSKELKDFDPEKEIRADWEEEKIKLKERAEQRKVKWLREQSYKVDVIKELLKESLSKAEPHIVEVNPIKISTKTSKLSNCTLWFEFSDLQLGTLITSEEMGGLNKHNWIIWKEKLEVWKNQVIDKIRQYSETNKIDSIVLSCLGDMVEGQDIFKGQLWQIDRHVVDQSILGANDTAAAFIEIFMTFPQLNFHILEVFGNHGRVQRKGESPYSCSMDKIYQRLLQLQIEKIPSIKNVTYHENEAWFYFVEIYGWNHLLLHGDQGMSGLWSSRPTINGLEKGLSRWNQMLQQQVHFLHCGHFHSSAMLSMNIARVLVNGSFIGTSTFSATQMLAASPPEQIYHVFTPKHGLETTGHIYLNPENVKSPIPAKSCK